MEELAIKNNWEFTEVWIDPMLSPPYILLLLCDRKGNCRIYDPKQGDKVVFSCNSYETTKLWLLKNEYQPVEGRLLAAKLLEDIFDKCSPWRWEGTQLLKHPKFY